ncbi:kinase-like domain-containing protein [Xylariaceae sp. FL0594]|nr:kinase-like domain-containing protein [Xylariaceae sp. FL0594]
MSTQSCVTTETVKEDSIRISHHDDTDKLASESSAQSAAQLSQIPSTKPEAADDDFEKEIYQRFIPIPEFENVQQYRKGGYHPVHLGDMLNGRYEVLHKHGSGGFSIVWLCWDTLESKWRAVKIMTAKNSSFGREAQIYSRLRAKASTQALIEENHLVIPLDEFWIDGPNGRHLCLVLPVLGETLEAWGLGSVPYEQDTQIQKKNFCRQIAEAVGFLHRAGICHGDLKPTNVLVRLDKVEDMGKDELLDLIGEPETSELIPLSGEPPAPHRPDYIVKDASLEWKQGLASSSVAIIDFGESFSAEKPPEEDRGMSCAYAPPEVLLRMTDAHGYGSDIWSLVATFYDIKADYKLFDGAHRIEALESI